MYALCHAKAPLDLCESKLACQPSSSFLKIISIRQLFQKTDKFLNSLLQNQSQKAEVTQYLDLPSKITLEKRSGLYCEYYAKFGQEIYVNNKDNTFKAQKEH